jgi:hypothetical protein
MAEVTYDGFVIIENESEIFLRFGNLVNECGEIGFDGFVIGKGKRRGESFGAFG